MEERKLKMNFFKSGSGSINAKATLPVTRLRTINITPEERDFIVILDEKNKSLIIKKQN